MLNPTTPKHNAAKTTNKFNDQDRRKPYWESMLTAMHIAILRPVVTSVLPEKKSG
jgi:hypothetical protein